MKRLLKIDFVRFCIVGASGFLINLVLLTLLYKILKMPIFFAQLISGEIALFSNFILHHNWTYKYRKSTKSVKSLLIQFHATSWIAIVGSAAIVYGGTHWLKVTYIVALVISALISLLWNFAWTKLVIWRPSSEAIKKEGVE
jgi:putative flippase GtrA